MRTDNGHADRIAQIRKTFTQLYGKEPDHWVRAPGRVELLGTDTDDAEGYVLTMAIDRDTTIAFSKAADRNGRYARVHSTNLESTVEFDLPPHGTKGAPLSQEKPSWASYVYGVAAVLSEAGVNAPAFDAVISSTVPVGAGLSSSASLELAAVSMLLELTGESLPLMRQALLSQQAEHEYAKVNCGILDQYSAAFGKAGSAMLLDCRALSHVLVAIPEDISIVIANTNVSRSLADSEYGTWKDQCLRAASLLSEHRDKIRTLRDVTPKEFAELGDYLEDEKMRQRAQFIVEENVRAVEITAALVDDDREAIRRLTAASFEGMRDLYGKTVPEMERMFEAMKDAPGFIGGRQSGGGFGGCLIAYVESERVDSFVRAVEGEYKSTTGIAPDVFVAESADGNGVLSPVS